MRVILYTDGGARGNPGPAGLGVVIWEADGMRRGGAASPPSGRATTAGRPYDKGRILAAFGEYLGETTNNQAEYRAMIAALARAKELGATEVDARADSELLVKQLNRQYKVKNAGLAPLFMRVWNLAQSFRRCTFSHVRREQNKDADAMVNRAIDARGRVEGKNG